MKKLVLKRKTPARFSNEKVTVHQLVLMLEFVSYYLRRIRQCQPEGARKLEHCAAAAHLRSALTYEYRVRARLLDQRLLGNVMERKLPQLLPISVWKDFITPRISAPVARRQLRAKT